MNKTAKGLLIITDEVKQFFLPTLIFLLNCYIMVVNHNYVGDAKKWVCNTIWLSLLFVEIQKSVIAI